MPEQLFVVVNLERVDRGLSAFAGLTTALNQNAQRGADSANDPPGVGPNYVLDDAEWAGGSSNGLDAVYGWMYDDGFDSGNLDCLHRGAAGCWGHRKGILDDFGSGANLVMGAAVEATATATVAIPVGRPWRSRWPLRTHQPGRSPTAGPRSWRPCGPALPDGSRTASNLCVLLMGLETADLRQPVVLEMPLGARTARRAATARPSGISTCLRPCRSWSASWASWASTTRA